MLLALWSPHKLLVEYLPLESPPVIFASAFDAHKSGLSSSEPPQPKNHSLRVRILAACRAWTFVLFPFIFHVFLFVFFCGLEYMVSFRLNHNRIQCTRELNKKIFFFVVIRNVFMKFFFGELGSWAHTTGVGKKERKQFVVFSIYFFFTWMPKWAIKIYLLTIVWFDK